MKKLILLLFLSGYLAATVQAQAIFDPNIHTAVPFGDVNSPFAEGAENVIDQNPQTKYLDFFLEDGIGFEVDLLGQPAVASILEFVTANDVPARDPVAFVVSGSNDGNEYEQIAEGAIPCNPERFLSRTFGFTNSTPYTFYRVELLGQCGPANSNQVAEVQLYSVIGSAPVLTCPDTVSIATDPGSCFGTADFAISAADEEDGSLSPFLISGLASGEGFPFGETPVTYGVNDADGNLGSCSFPVIVTDEEAPTVNCADISVTVEAGQTGAVVDYSDIASDNCSLISPREGFIPLLTIDGNAYYLSDTPFSPVDALINSLDNDGFLGTIRSEADELRIRAAIDQLASVDVLIGYSDVDDEGNFAWFSEDPADYDNWNPDEPNDAGDGEDYTIMIPSQGWNDVAEDSGPYFYLFEIPYEPIVTEGIASGGQFPIGVTSNTVEYYDAEGNLTTCSFEVTVEVGTDTENAPGNTALRLSENPVREESILFNEQQLLLQEVDLLDAGGRLVRQFDQVGTRSSVSLDMSGLGSGMYFLRVRTELGPAMLKLIKL